MLPLLPPRATLLRLVFMMLYVALWSALVLAQAPPPAGGPGFGAPPTLFTIEGYLDAAPPDAKVLEKAQVAAGNRERTLLITEYWRIGTGNRADLVRELGRFHPDFLLQGTPSDLPAIVEAPAGTRIHGTFSLSRGGLPKLLITELAVDPPAGAS